MPYKDPARRYQLHQRWRGQNRERDRYHTRVHKQRRQTLLAEIKLARGCVDCGYNTHPDALDFDHIDPAAKSFTISHASVSLERLMLEVAKCEVRCANCHRIKTAERRAG